MNFFKVPNYNVWGTNLCIGAASLYRKCLEPAILGPDPDTIANSNGATGTYFSMHACALRPSTLLKTADSAARERVMAPKDNYRYKVQVGGVLVPFDLYLRALTAYTSGDSPRPSCKFRQRR